MQEIFIIRPYRHDELIIQMIQRDSRASARLLHLTGSSALVLIEYLRHVKTISWLIMFHILSFRDRAYPWLETLCEFLLEILPVLPKSWKRTKIIERNIGQNVSEKWTKTNVFAVYITLFQFDRLVVPFGEFAFQKMHVRRSVVRLPYLTTVFPVRNLADRVQLRD